jgi:enoyl-CoA hydratase
MSDTDTQDLVLLERRDDGVAVIRLNRGKLNPLSQALLRRLHEVVTELHDDLPGVVVTGNDRSFAAGADISEFGDAEVARGIGATFAETFEALATFPRATIAAVNGFALGGGCELALCCDFMPGTTPGSGSQILLGVIPGGVAQRLPRVGACGPRTHLHRPSGQARRGAGDRPGRRGRPAAETLDRASPAGVASGAVIAQALAKRAIDGGLDRSLADGIVLEQELFVDVFTTEDAATGVASFLEHGPGQATFSGR